MKASVAARVFLGRGSGRGPSKARWVVVDGKAGRAGGRSAVIKPSEGQ